MRQDAHEDKPFHESDVIPHLLNGASVHQICAKFPISFERVCALQERVAEETKQEIVNHKIIVRSAIRKNVPLALDFVAQVLRPNPKTRVGRQIESDLETSSGRAKVGLQLKAAQLMLNSAKDALSDNLLTALMERPVETLSPTLFDPDFESRLGEDGSIRLIVNNSTIEPLDDSESEIEGEE